MRSVDVRYRVGFILRWDMGLADLCILHPLRTRRPHDHAGVVNHTAIAGLNLSIDDPGVLRELRRKKNVDVVEDAVLGNGVRFWHFVDDVRLDVPSVGPPFWRRLVLGGPFRCSADPPSPPESLYRRHPAFARLQSDRLRIRKPRRHLSGQNGFLDGLCPRACRFIGEE